jgi:hypothetical protein
VRRVGRPRHHGLLPSLVNAFEAVAGVFGGRTQLSVDLWHERRRNLSGRASSDANVFSTARRRLIPRQLPSPRARLRRLRADWRRFRLGRSALTIPPRTRLAGHHRHLSQLRKPTTGADFAEGSSRSGLFGGGNYSGLQGCLLQDRGRWLVRRYIERPGEQGDGRLRYSNSTPQPFGWELRGRYVAGFPVASGVYNGWRPIRCSI